MYASPRCIRQHASGHSGQFAATLRLFLFSVVWYKLWNRPHQKRRPEQNFQPRQSRPPLSFSEPYLLRKGRTILCGESIHIEKGLYRQAYNSGRKYPNIQLPGDNPKVKPRNKPLQSLRLPCIYQPAPTSPYNSSEIRAGDFPDGIPSPFRPILFLPTPSGPPAANLRDSWYFSPGAIRFPPHP